MKKQLIGTLVGAIILFLWQFLSWSALQIHKAEFGYTANQDSIMAALGKYLPGEGMYMIPNVPPGSDYAAEEALMKAWNGKPWAHISYHQSMNSDMMMPLVRGFAVDIVTAFLLIWLLLKIDNLNFQTAFMASVAIGFMGYLTIPYLNSVWFETNSVGYLIDAVVQWGLVGAWLGWWLPRK